MFVTPTGAVSERQAQQSRGYVLGIILLIMFLSSQDFAPPSRRRAEAAHAATKEGGITRHRDEIKEKVRRARRAATTRGGAPPRTKGGLSPRGGGLVAPPSARPSSIDRPVGATLNRRRRAADEERPSTPSPPPARVSAHDQIIIDLSASNERLEIENRKLKVATIGLMSELRQLGHPASAAAYNLTGVGVYDGADFAAEDDDGGGGGDGRKEKGLAGSSDEGTQQHVDEGMRLREEARAKRTAGRKASAGKEGGAAKLERGERGEGAGAATS
jgi:hypothetical protein